MTTGGWAGVVLVAWPTRRMCVFVHAHPHPYMYVFAVYLCVACRICVCVCWHVCSPSLQLLILRPPHIVNGLPSPPARHNDADDEEDVDEALRAEAISQRSATLTFTHLTALSR